MKTTYGLNPYRHSIDEEEESLMPSPVFQVGKK